MWNPYYNGPGFLDKHDICVHTFSGRSFSLQKRFSSWILLRKQWEIHGPLKSIEIVVLTSVGFDQAFDAIAVHPEVIHLNFQDLKIAWHRYWKFSLEDCAFSVSGLVWEIKWHKNKGENGFESKWMFFWGCSFWVAPRLLIKENKTNFL